MDKVYLVTVAVVVICTKSFSVQAKADGCSGYILLDKFDRADSYNVTPSIPSYDDTLANGWYKFGGFAGNQISQVCRPASYCNTLSPGWLNGSHPLVADGPVQRKVCFSDGKDCCGFDVNITVLNCNGFYVYYLTPTSKNYRYCGNGLSSTKGV
ncbi:oncoprotein-induced transcript 3 protein-like [Montipora capricornis]|uniref:oncoprotein-induced transcript 3 protein-like n=1 Tax=Montipora capricornis TaxID=246305 RepID=UPI0035F20F33